MTRPTDTRRHVADELADAHEAAEAARVDVVTTGRAAVKRRPGETRADAAHRAEIERLTAERDAARAALAGDGRARLVERAEAAERDTEQIIEQLVTTQKQLGDTLDELNEARKDLSLARVDESVIRAEAMARAQAAEADARTRITAAEQAIGTAQRVARAQVADARRHAAAAWREHARERELRIIAQRSLDMALDTIRGVEPVVAKDDTPADAARATLNRAISRAERALARAVAENLGATRRPAMSRHATARKTAAPPAGG